ncbi:O(6)-methylguanine-induced apoptosis 2 [Polyrhizophydium stewartii]|uniref:O(6)-methylguanine-induced apoptosis 2 n=1 Tax=Polyrhizophydium stewartii TaxID=2732419 RepID=A0ABR4NFS0_9FUNG
MTPIAFPGPGRYDVARGADNMHRAGPVSRSNFLSKSPRFPNDPSSKLPGPGFYHPIQDIKFRSFHLNIEKHWT